MVDSSRVKVTLIKTKTGHMTRVTIIYRSQRDWKGLTGKG